MQIHVENLGRIRQATLELKPFTVFIGPNNTNKTWLAYVVYALQDGGVWRTFAENILRRFNSKALTQQHWLELINQYQKSGVINYQLIFDNIDLIIAEFWSYFTKALIYDFIKIDSKSNAFKSLKIIVELSELDKINAMNSLRRKEIQVHENNLFGEYQFLKEADSLELTVRTSKETDKLSLFSKILYSHIFLYIKNRLFGFNDPFMLPSDRIALSSFYKELFTIRIDENPNIAVQIRENMPYIYFKYLKFLSDVEEIFSNNPPTKHSSINELLENSIMEGKLGFRSKEIGREIYFSVNSDTSIPVKASSSMVRSVLGLSFFLKYYPRKKGLLIFDEPEMNLHPESIVKLTELLAMYVNQGNRLLVTTHSPYIIDHVNNLIAAGASQNDPEKIKEHFWLKRTKSFLKPDDVAAYCFNTDGTVENIFNRETMLIDWDTFSEVGNQMSNIYNYL